MTHPHAPPDATPLDGPFLRVFLASVALLVGGTAGLVLLTDPLGRFGTGLVPPVISADRDQKAALYRALPTPPATIVLGSSRSKTIAPACLEQLGGQPAFNFAVNGAGAEDLVAVLRFLLNQPGARPRQLLVGVDPEMLQSAGELHRALDGSRALARYAPDGGPSPTGSSLGADLLGWQAVAATLRGLSARLQSGDTLPETSLEADGLQRYPRAEAALRASTDAGAARVLGSIPGILGRYESFTGLDSSRVADLRRFVEEADSAAVHVVAFIPPVHPAFARAAGGTAWAPRTRETVALLRTFAQAGKLRYVELAGLLDGSADTTQFVDAIHFLAPVAARVAQALILSPAHCALQ